MSGAIHPLPHICLHGMQRDTFTFELYEIPNTATNKISVAVIFLRADAKLLLLLLLDWNEISTALF
jgi:hypothetical protein